MLLLHAKWWWLRPKGFQPRSLSYRTVQSVQVLGARERYEAWDILDEGGAWLSPGNAFQIERRAWTPVF
jgi:hypothetical protein